MTFDRAAFVALIVLAGLLGLGDVAPSSPLSITRVLLPVAILLALLARRRALTFPTALAWPVLAWLAVLVASAVFAPTHQLEALAALERPVSGALLVWAVFAICRSASRALALARAVAIGGAGIALLGLAQASGNPVVEDSLAALHAGAVPIGDVPRIASTLSHPNLAAILLELALPLLIAWTWTARRAWRPVLGVASFATLLALVLTFSRAGIMAGLIAPALMAILSIARGRTQPAAYLALAGLAVPLALLWTASADPGLDRRLTAGLDESGSLSPSRLDYWSVAWRMAIDHPLLGVGPDNYRWAFAAYAGLDVNNLGVHAHNQFLDTLASTGALGLLSLIALLGALFRVAARRLVDSSDASWPWRLALLGSLCAWLVHGLLDDFEHFWPASVAFWLIAGLTVRLANFEAAQDAQQRLGRIALGRELHARPQRFAAVLGSTAERDDVAIGAHLAESLEDAAWQARQVPVEQDDVRAAAHDLLDQPAASRALRHD